MMIRSNHHLPNDTLLLQQISQNSKGAFNALYEKYWESAYCDAFKRVKDTDQAKDIVQDIFTHIWLHRETLHIENLPAYLSTAIRNKVIKLATKQKLTHPFFDLLENSAERMSRADGDLLWKEFLRSYEALLKTLPPKRQMIFRLHFHEELPTKEISAKLNLSRKTVQNQLGKAIEKLKVSLMHFLSLLVILFTTL